MPPQERFVDATLKRFLPTNPSLTLDQWRALQQDLRDIAEDFLTIVLTTPMGVTLGPPDIPLSKRAVWVERHLFNPASELLEALSDANAPMWSGWPDLLDIEGPDRARLIHELEALRDFSRDLAWNLQSRSETAKTATRKNRQSSRGANQTQEFRLDLANALREVFARYYSELPVSRGTYVPSHGMQGHFRSFVSVCFTEILGEDISDHLLQALLKPMRDDELGAD